MPIPVANPKAQNLALKDEITAAVQQVFESGQFILGPNVAALEEECPAFCEAKYGIAVNSGTDALVVALGACGVGPGDEVITTPFTFVATTEAIKIVGATPVYADIDPDTYNLDPAQVEKKITERTRALMPVHLFGQCADIDAYAEIAAKYNLKLIYDGAQAIGAKSRDKGIGVYGDAATLSFYPTKNLGGCGDGGMVLTNDDDIYQMSRSLRFHGMNGNYTYEHVGYCSRLDEVQAAVLRIKLRRIAEWNDGRRRNADFYIKELTGLLVKLPVAQPENYHVYHQFTIRHPKRNELKAKLGERGVGSAVFYPNPLHLEKPYLHLGYKPGDFPEAEKAASEVLSLPIYPELTHVELEQVAGAIREAVMELE